MKALLFLLFSTCIIVAVLGTAVYKEAEHFATYKQNKLLKNNLKLTNELNRLLYLRKDQLERQYENCCRANDINYKLLETADKKGK